MGFILNVVSTVGWPVVSFVGGNSTALQMLPNGKACVDLCVQNKVPCSNPAEPYSQTMDDFFGDELAEVSTQ